MPSIDERVTTLEVAVETLLNHVHGGGRVRYRDSVDGRLYDVRQTLLAAEKLAEATREVRRERAHRWSKREKLALFTFAALTALAPYVLLIAHAASLV